MSYCRQEGESGAAMETGRRGPARDTRSSGFLRAAVGPLVGLTWRFPDEKGKGSMSKEGGPRSR